VTTQATRPGLAVLCLLCCGPVDPAEPCRPAFALALAGITAHAGCCASSPTWPEPAIHHSKAAA
jgi:hypothetical protein